MQFERILTDKCQQLAEILEEFKGQFFLLKDTMRLYTAHYHLGKVAHFSGVR